MKNAKGTRRDYSSCNEETKKGAGNNNIFFIDDEKLVEELCSRPTCLKTYILPRQKDSWFTRLIHLFTKKTESDKDVLR